VTLCYGALEIVGLLLLLLLYHTKINGNGGPLQGASVLRCTAVYHVYPQVRQVNK